MTSEYSGTFNMLNAYYTTVYIMFEILKESITYIYFIRYMFISKAMQKCLSLLGSSLLLTAPDNFLGNIPSIFQWGRNSPMYRLLISNWPNGRLIIP